MTAPMTVAPHRSYRHEAFLYDGDDDFIEGTVPFVQDAVGLDQPVMVAVSKPRLDKLRSALGAEADQVCFVDMAELGHNPARIIPGWRRFVDDHAGPGRAVRGVGEPIWAGRRPAEVVEAQFHEALLNLVIDPDTPLWLRCPYDVSSLDAAFVEEASRSHPAIAGLGGYRGSRSYRGLHARDMFSEVLPVPETAAERHVIRASDLLPTRAWLAGLATRAGIDADRVTDLTVAVNEVATNSIRHGGGSGSIRVWQSAEALICEVTDRGHLDDPLVGRRAPTPEQVGGRGVWLANQLCDLVQIRSSPQGTTVRIFTWTEQPPGRRR